MQYKAVHKRVIKSFTVLVVYEDAVFIDRIIYTNNVKTNKTSVLQLIPLFDGSTAAKTTSMSVRKFLCERHNSYGEDERSSSSKLWVVFWIHRLNILEATRKREAEICCAVL